MYFESFGLSDTSYVLWSRLLLATSPAVISPAVLAVVKLPTIGVATTNLKRPNANLLPVPSEGSHDLASV